MLQRIAVCLLLLGISVPRLKGSDLAEQKWVEIKTENFTIVSNGSDKQARQVAKEFEQIRGVLIAGFPQLRVQSFVPIVVLALKSGDDLKELLSYRAPKVLPGGLFLPGWENSYAVVRLDQRSFRLASAAGNSIIGIDVHPETLIYHEYVHELLHLNFARLPLWLNEGLSEFYGNTGVGDKEARIGVPSPGLAAVRNRPLIPLAELLKAGPRSKYYTEQDLQRMFYAQSWALTHFLMFGPGMGKGDTLSAFMNRLQGAGAVDDVEVFRQTFGDLKAVESRLNEYVANRQFMIFELKNPPQADESSYHTQNLTPPEATLRLAAFQLALRKPNEALVMIEGALAEMPNIALAHRLHGFAAFDSGMDDLALQEFSRAAVLDSTDYMSAYYAAVLRFGQATDVSALPRLVQELQRARDLNSRFAPVHIELSRAFVRMQRLDLALRAAQYAAGLEPGRVGYHLNVARILLIQDKPQEAADIARYVALHWYGTDRDQALEILKEAQERIASRKAEEHLQPAETAEPISDAPKGELVSIIVSQITCGEKGELKKIVPIGPNKIDYFVPSKTMDGGFEDTLWYGRDHFSYCHHLEGRRVEVISKPLADKPGVAEILRMRVCDDLPAMH